MSFPPIHPVKQITQDDIIRGVTIAANGFYGPQGRKLRLPLADPELNRKIEAFEFNDSRITNFEMEVRLSPDCPP